MNLISDREHLLMVVEMYHCAIERETQESERLHIKWEATYDSLKRTQESLQESRLQIDLLQKDLNVPHPPSRMGNDHVHMVGNNLDIMEESHAEDAELQVLEKIHDEEYFGQELVGFEKKDQQLLAMGNIYEGMKIESTSKSDYLFMDWVDKYII